MIDYKDLKMKCTSSHPQEPFYTEGKEYDILKNKTGFYIKCDEGDILEYGTTPFDLEHNPAGMRFIQGVILGLGMGDVITMEQESELRERMYDIYKFHKEENK